MTGGARATHPRRLIFPDGRFPRAESTGDVHDLEDSVLRRLVPGLALVATRGQIEPPGESHPDLRYSRTVETICQSGTCAEITPFNSSSRCSLVMAGPIVRGPWASDWSDCKHSDRPQT